MKNKELTAGQKRAKTLKERYGNDYYKHLGKKGGNPILLAHKRGLLVELRVKEKALSA